MQPHYPNAHYLAEVDWLQQHLGDDGLRILDLRFDLRLSEAGEMEEVSGRDDYLAGHIPGAQFVDLVADLVNPTDPNSIINPESFAKLMTTLGIDANTTVVVYDDRGGLWAARLWWALRYYGHDQAMLLNGGLSRWRAANYALEQQPTAPAATQFTATINAPLRVSKEQVLAAIDAADSCIIDALPEVIYRGDIGLYPGLRQGHIPGAANVFAEHNLDQKTSCLKPMAALQEVWRDADITPEQTIITYCGGGVFAAFALFVLVLMGHEKVALYDASWKEWGDDPSLPVEAS